MGGMQKSNHLDTRRGHLGRESGRGGRQQHQQQHDLQVGIKISTLVAMVCAAAKQQYGGGGIGSGSLRQSDKPAATMSGPVGRTSERIVLPTATLILLLSGTRKPATGIIGTPKAKREIPYPSGHINYDRNQGMCNTTILREDTPVLPKIRQMWKSLAKNAVKNYFEAVHEGMDRYHPRQTAQFAPVSAIDTADRRHLEATAWSSSPCRWSADHSAPIKADVCSCCIIATKISRTPKT